MASLHEDGERALAEINITPLVDVLLVLLVIFMIAAPVLTERVDLDLPQITTHPPPPTEQIHLRIDAAGQVWWNGNVQPLAALEGLMAEAVAADPRHSPLLQIDANADADYGVVVRVLGAAQNARMGRISFVQPR